MNFSTIGRIAGALALTLGLAGCIDMTNDIYVTSATTAKATITSTMSKDIYAMIKAGGASDDPFCQGENDTLTENDDGSGTCVTISEGDFAELKFDDSGSKPIITSNDDGTVRIAVATAGMVGDLGADDDPQTAAMMKQMFEGHFLTIRLGGREIVESNLEADPDDPEYVAIQIPFLSLMDGSADLPEELYAVIRP